MESFEHLTELNAGDILFPAAGLDCDMNDSNGYFWGNFTLVLKTKVPA